MPISGCVGVANGKLTTGRKQSRWLLCHLVSNPEVVPMKNSLIALALLAAAPFAASAADGLSYNYAQADYVKTDADAGKADGWGVKGSYEFIPHVHAFGEYNQQKADLTDAKTDQWRVGVGYNREIGNSTDFVGRVATTSSTRSRAWTSTATAPRPVSAPRSVPTPRSMRWPATRTTPRSTASTGRRVLRPSRWPGEVEPELGHQWRPQDERRRRQGMVDRPALQLVTG